MATANILTFSSLLVPHMCSIAEHGCDHFCINTPGSYMCKCKQGYILNADQKTCSSKFSFITLFFLGHVIHGDSYPFKEGRGREVDWDIHLSNWRNSNLGIFLSAHSSGSSTSVTCLSNKYQML